MPECPELHLAGRFINTACGALVFAGGVERSPVGRGPEVPFRSEAYSISAIARGKELRLTLSALDAAVGPPPQDLVFRFGMSGSFRLCPAAELPRHAHLRFLTRESPPRALCFVDPRRFGSWRLGDAWQPERGPCVISEYQAFRENVLKNLDDRAFDKPICEVLLNQKYFNGIGNYLRAEILYRLKIPPFEKARTVLEALQEQEKSKKDPSLTLSKKVKLRQENPDLLELCHTVPTEVITAELLDPEHSDNYAAFKNWLQCYLVPGMSSLRDRNGRTIWFQGEPGPMAPKGQKPRKVSRKESPQLKVEPEAPSPTVTPRASKQRHRTAVKTPKSELKEEEKEEEADGPRKGRGRRKATAASALPEVPLGVRRSRRISARRGEGAAPAV
ncbi:PREDICTED: endonuclease 8-like 1 isoform X1 [Sturnus vulgaris]|uniref:endonuclease 8-like 1 isoform X1 n=1 Tax=Sturnus vulgaris TaxID=9172 RepID=UPI000719F523|nr:PREDICTED: endonuclease 8-like 1 isoform X1 [Sturnus vulgaris]